MIVGGGRDGSDAAALGAFAIAVSNENATTDEEVCNGSASSRGTAKRRILSKRWDGMMLSS